MSEPDQIRAEIERTRGDLSGDVNALTEHVRPGNVAHRQVDRARGAVTSMKERLMGAADTVNAKAHSATSTSSDTVSGVPERAMAHTRGNPLAAGLIALGAGWLVGSILPASQKEADAAATVKDNVSTLAQPITDAAKSAAAELKGPAQEAIESVKSTATDAAATVKDEGASSAQDVKSQAQDAKDAVQDARA